MAQKVLGLPTILFYRDGAIIAELTADITIEAVEAKIQELV